MAGRRSADEAIRDTGLRVAELRRRRGWSQEQLAAVLGFSLTYVKRVEAGTNLSVRSLVKFADAFELDVRALFEPPTN